MSRQRVGFTRRGDRATCARKISAPANRLLVDRQVMVKSFLTSHCEGVPSVYGMRSVVSASPRTDMLLSRRRSEKQDHIEVRRSSLRLIRIFAGDHLLTDASSKYKACPGSVAPCLQSFGTSLAIQSVMLGGRVPHANRGPYQRLL